MTHQNRAGATRDNNLLTASLTAKVSNLKSLSEAYKELENKKTMGEPRLEVHGTSTFGVNNTFNSNE